MPNIINAKLHWVLLLNFQVMEVNGEGEVIIGDKSYRNK